MQKTTKEKYIETSLELLQKQLAQEGIITRKIENFENTVLEIGDLYYQLKRKEDLV
ncbi:hypothetical protein [Bacillus atrophaeus]|uniref:hypothetical protein n=1 Tax=Bacillus atrophaeus TaxID=1452 RepID=UPI00227EA7D9|nr:hypothetical protein [Bacillus atrophaeus]MCY7865975.1 hypothetical protein [Bacillus spizizenii]MCY8890464.1 hypothetical protein [Bacillus spizizenii]MEC0841919.1 hypothetical protein [Bacillus spizizenii]MED1125191.1 hypothetical protein [Bacillus atrophaeus]